MKCTSYVAMPYPMATIPPMSGEISMAPMMTATLFMFRPTQAIMMAMTRTMIRPRYRRIRKNALVDFFDGGGASL